MRPASTETCVDVDFRAISCVSSKKSDTRSRTMALYHRGVGAARDVYLPAVPAMWISAANPLSPFLYLSLCLFLFHRSLFFVWFFSKVLAEWLGREICTIFEDVATNMDLTFLSFSEIICRAKISRTHLCLTIILIVSLLRGSKINNYPMWKIILPFFSFLL